VSSLIDPDALASAAAAILGHVVRTPTVASSGLSALLGVPVTAKLELLQRTGSFKARGATVKLLSLTAAEREAGVVAVSGGNHAIAVADTAAALGIAATVVMPETASSSTIAACRATGADVRLTPDIAGAFALVEKLREDGLTLVHPFDDPLVVAGAGTVGLELREDASDLTDVLVSVGGGGLISGVAAALRGTGIRVWGVETVGATAMSDALAAGSPATVTLSSIVTSLSAPAVSALTLAHVRELVHEMLVVTDAEAVRGTLDLADHGKVWAEPAAGCLLPAARRVVDRHPDARLGLVVCGGNTRVRDLLGWADRFGV
jgi:threonine dehydratase